MLFRKSEWSLKFLEAVAELGRIPEPKLGEVSLRSAAFNLIKLRCLLVRVPRLALQQAALKKTPRARRWTLERLMRQWC